MSNPRWAPIQVYWVSIVSLLNDLSSEVVSKCLPYFLMTSVQAGVAWIGVVEAISEGIGSLARLWVGQLSDLSKKRKPFIVLGYALSVATRPFILISESISAVVSLRFADRFGKAIRNPPRDALIADLSDETNRGHHFGINRGLDTLGAVLGLAFAGMFLKSFEGTEAQGVRIIMFVASGVGLLALLVLIAFVQDVPRKAAHETTAVTQVSQVFHFKSYFSLPPRLRKYLVAAFFLSLGSSSDGFLVLRAQGLHLEMSDTLWALMFSQGVAATSAYFFTKRSDQWGRSRLFVTGWLIYLLCYLFLGMEELNKFQFSIVVAFYGLFYGLTDGVEKAMIADWLIPSHKGLAFGWLGLIQGVGLFISNTMFGLIYDKLSFQLAFWSCSFMTAVGLVLFADARWGK
ncbi:MAG: MFS transporter [Oligoflexia bacterium]|nr:MFS transporter [Oligoflexia bacterium]